LVGVDEVGIEMRKWNESGRERRPATLTADGPGANLRERKNQTLALRVDHEIARGFVAWVAIDCPCMAVYRSLGPHGHHLACPDCDRSVLFAGFLPAPFRALALAPSCGELLPLLSPPQSSGNRISIRYKAGRAVWQSYLLLYEFKLLGFQELLRDALGVFLSAET
jgi:hypothetical protein